TRFCELLYIHSLPVRWCEYIREITCRDYVSGKRQNERDCKGAKNYVVVRNKEGATGSDELVLNGIASRRAATRHLNLPIDRGHVGVDGAYTDDEVCGNLCIGPALRDQSQYFDLACCQFIGIGWCPG